MLTPSTPSTSGFRFRRPRWPLAPFRSSASSPSAATPKGLRRVAPVLPAPCASSSASSSAASVVLPLAPTRLSTATTATIGADKKAPYAFPMPSTIPRTLWPEGQKAPPAEPEELVYDERLKEWIFPIGETMAEELERLAYFCRTEERELVMSHLRHMPPGHFVLRVSGSRRRCLALSVRVAEDPQRNPKGIAHYLLLRNQHGFRIRGSRRYFPSLPMLVTHHSVLAEQLPCRLLLSDWRWTRGGDPSQSEQRRRQSSGGSTLAVLRAREERGDQQQDHFGCQSPDSTLVRWRRPLPLPGAMATTDVRTQTNSTLFSSKSSTILSA